MRSLNRSGLFVLVLALTLIIAVGCRTRTRVQPQTQPPVTTDTAPMIDPAPTPPTDVMDEPEFVDPAVDTEILPDDDMELNRLAQARGWIRDAFFNYDESTLTPDAQEALTMTASWLRANPNYNVTIEGHCDERGTEQYNLALGDRRANIARDYLATLGVDNSRMRTVSYGEERPFQTGTSESAYAANRRAHIVISRR
ncbi:MAG TPA: peptidoglycan-associated lipoprotein Pal [Thermoanaerobaculia bacterium]|nr:peptidoglycan-associated lipoprotein Pal [Thermoanaerobaculia bacterium]